MLTIGSSAPIERSRDESANKHCHRGYGGQINAGSSCASVTGFEQIVYGLPGVKYAWGPGVGPFVHELLYDANGNLVGEDTPIAFPPDANDPAYQDCGTSEGLTHNRFSSTITLFGGV